MNKAEIKMKERGNEKEIERKKERKKERRCGYEKK